MKNKFAAIIFALIALLVLGTSQSRDNVVAASTSSVCPGGDDSWSGDWYKDQSSPFGVNAGSGYIIDQVCIKGGSDNSNNGYLQNFTTNSWYTVTYMTNGRDPEQVTKNCVGASGIGTNTAGASHGDAAENACAGISHASFHRVAITTPTGVTPTGVTPTGVTPTGVTPTGVTPTGVTPTGVTPTGVTPTGVTPTGVTPTGVTPTGVTPTGVTPTGVTPTGRVTPTVTTVPTVTPTNAPGMGGPGDGLSDGRSDGKSDGGSTGGASVLGTSTLNDPYKGVLGVNTMAKTGSFEQNLMNIVGILGMLLVAAGFKSYKRELSK